MQRQSVTSRMVRSIGYDPSSQTLEVEFNNDAVHQYSDVTPAQHRALIEADSIGEHFHRHFHQRQHVRVRPGTGTRAAREQQAGRPPQTAA